MMSEEQLVDEDAETPPPIERSVWRVGPLGRLISNISEEDAKTYAAGNAHTIFFFAEFDTHELSHDDNTIIKVYQSMRDAGILERQATAAMHNMQNEGLYFREASHAPEL